MKKLIPTGLRAIDLAPAFALAQARGVGTSGSGTSGSGTSGTGSSGCNPSGSGTGAPSTSNPSVERSTNKADCERAGGKWQVAQKKYGLGG